MQDREDNLRRGTCAHCMSSADFRYHPNPRGGWECLNCGLYFPAETWEWVDGRLARRRPVPKPRKSYFNKEAWDGKKPGDSDEGPEVRAIMETGLSMEEFENL